MIGLLAFIQNLFHSHSVFVYHLFPHIANLLILVYVAKTTIELGGGFKAVFFVLMAVLIGPAFATQSFQPVVFSELFWILSFYQLVKYVKSPDQSTLWLLTICCIAGFLTKYDIIFFLFGLLSLAFFARTRRALIEHKFWWNILVFAICILPNAYWQASHAYPALQMFARLYETQLDKITRADSIKQLLIAINPIVSLLLFIPGIIYPIFSRRRQLLQPLAVAVGLSFALLVFKNGKAYYFFPLALTILTLGAVCLERLINRKAHWLFYPVTALLIAGSIMIPFGAPILSFPTYLKAYYPLDKKEIPGGKYGVKAEAYYTREKWDTTMRSLKSVYDSLPSAEKANCLIWGKHYGQAGAVNLFRDQYGLPPAFSYHGSFYSWSPSGPMPTTIIGLSYRVGDFFQPYFGKVTIVRTIYNPYATDPAELFQYVYLLQAPRQGFDAMKELFKNRIFE